jgi:hypothetical protein
VRTDGERILGGLITGHHLATFETLPALTARNAAAIGFADPLLYAVDLQNQYLVPLPGQLDPKGEPLDRLRIDTTVAGMAYRVPRIVETSPGSAESQRWWVPLIDGTERMGVLAVTVPRNDDEIRARAAELGALIGLMMAGKRSASDAYARLVRTRPMHLSAELLWSMLPTRTFATEQVVVSAALEPAYKVGGDAFDYAFAGDILHVSVFDAMGHDTTAGLTAAIAMSACRNNRRQGAGLFETGEAIDAAIGEQFGQTQFATGILADLDTRTGHVTWVNRGHHPPLVLRRGRLAAVLETVPDPPMGFLMGATQQPARYQLEPGDRLLFYSDGVVEARNPEGEEFGLDRFVDFVLKREADGVSAPETLRRLVQALLDHQQDLLQDDATVLLVEWRTERHRQLVL